MIAGDLNLVLDLDLDKQGGKRVTNSKSAEKIKAFMESNNLLDIGDTIMQIPKGYLEKIKS